MLLSSRQACGTFFENAALLGMSCFPLKKRRLGVLKEGVLRVYIPRWFHTIYQNTIPRRLAQLLQRAVRSSKVTTRTKSSPVRAIHPRWFVSLKLNLPTLRAPYSRGEGRMIRGCRRAQWSERMDPHRRTSLGYYRPWVLDIPRRVVVRPHRAITWTEMVVPC